MNQPQGEEERDDAIVGQAFVWSGGLLLALIVVAVGVVLWLRSQKPPVVEVKTELDKPKVRETRVAEVPAMPFTDITASAGITFVHENGAAGQKLLPETMGGGCAFLDYDGDGDQDILFVNSTRWGWDEKLLPLKTMALYRNDGDCKFVDVTQEAKLDVSFYGQGVAVGDYDSDGDVDLYFTAVGGNRLFRNDAATFVDVTADAGVGGQPEPVDTSAADSSSFVWNWSTSSGFLDYDNDGDLDLFVCNYVKWSKEFDLAQPFTLTGGERAYGRPQVFPGTFPYLYRNDGGGKFTEVGKEAGLQIISPLRKDKEIAVAKSLGVTFADFNNDGWIDIAVANDTVQNFLFRNEGNGTFAEEAILRNIAFDQQGDARGAMGIDAGRIRDGKAFAIAIGNFANEMTAFYVSQGDSMQFTDEAIATGIGPQSRIELKFGTLFVDVDLDGRLDVVSANGHLENEINKVQASQTYEQPPHFFWNCGPASKTEFCPVPREKCGEDYLKRMVGRGAATADIDGDGDLDLLFAATGAAPRLLRNDQQLGQHWLRVDVSGAKGQRGAIGAKIEVETNAGKFTSQVMPTRGYLSQSELPVTIGLGRSDTISRVTVTWPGGERKTIENPAIDKVLTVAP